MPGSESSVTAAHRAEAVWGTVITVDVRDEVDPAVVDECFAWFDRVDQLFSTWHDDTEIMRIGRGELDARDAGPEVQEVLRLCDDMHRESNGAFDVRAGAHARVPPRPGLAPLDPSGLVKGWAAERAADLLTRAGARDFSVDAGGDVVVRGRRRVGIRHPWERDKVAAVLDIHDGAVATSGRYERGDHVIDPRTGLPAEGFVSVTVVGSDLAIADAYATAALVLGPDEGLQWLVTRAGYEGMAITADREVVVTPGFARFRVS